MTELLLEMRGLRVAYGRALALHGVSLTVTEGQIVGLLGANGAGKSTTLKTLAGLLRPRAGSIHFAGREISRWPAYRRVETGIALVPEGRELFRSLTVLENLRMGAFAHRPGRAARQTAYEEVFAYFPALAAKRHAQAASLSGGEGQMLAIGRALLSRPRLLLLDEPSHGLAPQLVDQLFQSITRIARERHLTVILVEQNAGKALEVASFCYVLETGQVAMAGDSAALSLDERVRRLYLGG